jgi:hypothetical protein
MVVQDRYSALQNENVRLFRVFQKNAFLLDLPEVPTVTIIAQNGVDVIGTATAVYASTGFYYADWFVPISLPTGRYYDKWSFRFTANDPVTEVVNYFEVHPKDAIMNFSPCIVSNNYTPGMERAIRDLANFFVYEVQHIPIYAEQAQRTADRARFNFAFPNWNTDPRPLIRVNNRIVDEGWYADYAGNVFFEKQLDQSDTVFGSYYFSYFKKDDMAGFIQMGLNAMNAIPPASQNYSVIDRVPSAWMHGIMIYAAMQALRRLLLGMTMQEISIIFGDKEQAAAARETFKALYEEYAAIWTAMSKDIKKTLPMIGQFVMPEYTLPGGRARWYRYMFVGGSGAS